MHLSKIIVTRFAAVMLSFSCAILPALAVSGTVSADGGLRLRESFGTNASVLTTLPDAAEVQVLSKTEDGWFQVSYQNFTGFVSGEYLNVSQADANTLEVYVEPLYGRVTEGPLNVRSSPDTESQKVTQLSAGSVIEIIGTNDGWHELEAGFVSADYVTIIDAEVARAAAVSSGKGSDVVAYAKQYLGSRYAYGGSSPSGFDCSGFVKYVYSNFGITLSRTASSQMDHGTPVGMSELQAGDLVFFLKKGSGASRASHVGIYIGGGQFIHASTSSTGVIVSDMDSAYYTSGFVGGRRLV